jgi:uncharacterized cupin superfamily protein
MSTRPERPDFIFHYSTVMKEDNAHYPGSDELLCINANLGRAAGFERVGISVDVLPPGRRTSWPHAEADEEEFVFVLEGHPQAWIDGVLHDLGPGDFVGFPAGTGIAHTIINNTDETVRLLVGGDKSRKGSRAHYPLHPKRNEEIGDLHWRDAPTVLKGDHDGLPDAQRKG